MKVKSILVSQPAPASIEKSPFNELIQKYGVEIDFMPFIRIEAETAKNFRSQRIDVLSHSAIIFTSRGNVDTFFKICEENRVVIPDEMKYFCTTEAIALYLQKYIVYRKRKIFFGKGSFSDLMDIVVKHKEEKFLLGVSEPHKPEMTKALEKTKIKYTKMVLSHTVSEDLTGKVDISKYDIAVFYSLSDVQSFHESFPKEDGKSEGVAKIATFGTTTTLIASQLGIEVSVMASTKTFPSMITALDYYITTTAKGEQVDKKYIADAIKEELLHNEQIISKAKSKSTRTRKTSCSSTTKKSTTASTTKKCSKTAVKPISKCTSKSEKKGESSLA
ncbi:MAG: uroporphyrinogen-III synthase [Rikenellaceae bacterium]